MKALVISRRQTHFAKQLEQNWGEVKTAQQILGDILSSTQLKKEKNGAMYAYGLRLILREIAQTLKNSEFCPYQSSYLETLDQALDLIGLENWRFNQLMSFSPPLSLPDPDDFPGVCTVRPAEVIEIYRSFTKIKLKHPDAEVIKSLKQAKDWFKFAAESQNGLVFFTL